VPWKEGALMELPFKGEKELPLRQALEAAGFDSSGKEVMYDGKTGKSLTAKST